MFPRQNSTCRAGREIGKAAGAAHAGRGALPAGARGWRRGQRAPTRPGRRPPPSPRSGGEIAVGQAGVRRGSGVGQAWDSPAPRPAPPRLCAAAAAAVTPGAAREGHGEGTPGLEQAAGISGDSEEQLWVISREPRAQEHRALPPPRRVSESAKNTRHSGV